MTADSESYEVPGGRVRTGSSLMDSEPLYHLRYPGVVLRGLCGLTDGRKMSKAAPSTTVETDERIAMGV